MNDQPKKHVFSTPDVSKMTEEERRTWIKQLHQRMVAQLLSDEDQEDTDQDPEGVE